LAPNPSALPNRRLHLWEFPERPGSTLGRLEQVYTASLQAVDGFADFRAASAQSNKYTEQGLKDEIQRHALEKLTPVFKKNRTTVEDARAEAAALRKKLALQPPDKADVAAAMMRAEIRQWLRGMSEKERSGYLVGNIDKLDSTVALAVLEAPAALSGGVPQSVMTELRDRALAAQHGEEAISQLAELESAISIADQANEAGREAVMHDLGIFDRKTFDELAAPHENRVAPAWLRTHRAADGSEKTVVIEPGYPNSDRSVVRPANAQDLANGKQYASYEEYAKDRATFVA
jgi:hypothetical protein